MNKATLIGFFAILMWSLLAPLTALSGSIPTFLLTALTFSIAAIPGGVLWVKLPNPFAILRQPWPIWLLGIIGLFGYHFLYFTALRHAPAIEATLINYLWPLFLVLGSALMPHEKLYWFHIGGAILGFSGVVLIISHGNGISLNGAHNLGYLCAFLAAFFWSGYSILSRRVAEVPTASVAAFCLSTSLLALICHFLFHEPFILPQNPSQWWALFLLGLFPVGLAFYCWDHGVKHGNIQLLGAASYATPLLSTCALILVGQATASWRLFFACLLVTTGAILASKNLLTRSEHQNIQSSS
ncbi:DMT family transporter [Bartonella sp. DGB2]|uniref:aromatic amino acid exporter YddG n=1 Tax=Bartonella sp. DGB2 TaxID=3388426 RepID=UPI00398FD12F